ncbi:hypothetical protein ACROYT_G012384 [Oculina patagonica]
MFPNNFVVDLSPAASDASSNTAVEKKAKVTFDYDAQDEDELTLHVGEVVDFMCEVEEGWWRGKLNGRIGVFPSNFAKLIEEKDVAQTKDKPVEKQNRKASVFIQASVTSGASISAKRDPATRSSGFYPALCCSLHSKVYLNNVGRKDFATVKNGLELAKYLL